MSSTSVRRIVAATNSSAGHIFDTYFLNSSNTISGIGTSLLQPLVTTVYQDPDDPLSRLRIAVTNWLIGNPYPSLGPRRAPLSDVLFLVKGEPSLAPILFNSAAPLTHLKLILLGPESREVFIIRNELDQELVMLDEMALRRAAASASTIGGEHDSIRLLSSAWQFSVGPAAGAAALPLTGACLNADNGRFSNDGSNVLTAAASFLTSSSPAQTSCSGSGPLRTVFSLGPDDREDPQANALSQTVLNAVALAWPGNNALARVKRRAALALAVATDGPEGPYSMLASAMGDVLHRHEADAVSELRHPVTKTLRVKQLLHEGGPTDGLPLTMTHGSGMISTMQLGLGGQALASGSGVGLSGAESPGFLRVVKGKYDIVVVLELPSLLQAHAHRQSGGMQSGGLSAAAGMTAGPLSPSASATSGTLLLQPSLITSNPSALLATSTAMHGAYPRLPLARSVSDLTTAMEHCLTLAGGGSQSGLAFPATSIGAIGSVIPSGVFSSLGAEGVPELALRAFPGPSVAAQLRRSIVVHLAGLTRRVQPWTHLGIFVASSPAHVWLKPANRWPKLKTFVMHPDSRGVFLDVQLPGSGSSGGLVALDPAALRRAAVAGLATAINSAWPGQGPLERIRRAAAFTLAFAVRGPAGPYVMLGSALGTAIRKRDKEAFDALAGMGKLSELLDDAAGTGAAANSGGGSGGGVESTVISRESLNSGGDGSGAGGVGNGGGSSAGAVTSPCGPRQRGSSDVAGDGAVTSSGQLGSGGGGATCAGSGHGGGGGVNGGAGYIVSFKKDQDGYMRLRLEALLQDWPREESAAAAAGTAASTGGASGLAQGGTAGTSPTPATISLSVAADDPASFPDGTFPQGLLAPAFSAPMPTSLSTSPPLPSPRDTGPSSGSSVDAVALIGNAPVTAGGGAAIANVPEVGSPPLELELMRLFPPPPGAAPGSEAFTIAAAKRCIARLLAWAPAPHQLTFAKLGAQVPKLLGGARIGRNLRLVCLEEPDVFSVQSQSPTVHVVRLASPSLLQLAHEQSERKLHSTSTTVSTTATSVTASLGGVTPPKAAMQQSHPGGPQPLQPPPQQQVMQMFMQQPHALVVQPPLTNAFQLSSLQGPVASSLAAQLQQLQQHQQQHQGNLAFRAGSGLAQQQLLQTATLGSHLPGAPGQLQSQMRVAGLTQQETSDIQQGQQQLIQNIQLGGGTAADFCRPESAGSTGWAGWQSHQQVHPHHQRQHVVVLQQQQQQQQQLQQPPGGSTLQHQTSLGSVNSNGNGSTVHQRLYDGRMSVNGSTAMTSFGSVGSIGRCDGNSPGRLSLESGPLAWQAAISAGSGAGKSLSHPHPHPHQNSQHQQLHAIHQRRQQMAAVSRAVVGQRIQDFAAAALSAEQAMLQQQPSAANAALPNTPIHVVSDPYSPEFLAVMQHCHACPQIGLSVQVYDSRPALVTLYAPAVAEVWAPAVYVLDCTASSVGEAPEAMAGVLLGSLRGLLEDAALAKVVHGCEQVRPLEVATGAAVAPLLDTSVLLNAVLTMLPPLPPPADAVAVAAAAAGPLPSGGYSPTEGEAVAQLCSHVGGLRTVLQSVELWADRPELLAVLGGVHFAALRVELWSAAGRDSHWLSRPLSEGQMAVAAQAAHLLPELWAALCEAVPWLAAHAALRVMQHLRTVASSTMSTGHLAAATTIAVPGMRLMMQRQV